MPKANMKTTAPKEALLRLKLPMLALLLRLRLRIRLRSRSKLRLRLVNTITCCALYKAQRTKNPKVQNLPDSLRSPKLLDFWFSQVFWFSNRNPKNTWCFLVFQQKSKTNTGFFGFSQKGEQENQKNPCVFWFST